MPFVGHLEGRKELVIKCVNALHRHGNYVPI